jgi:hypothetical protein
MATPKEMEKPNKRPKYCKILFTEHGMVCWKSIPFLDGEKRRWKLNLDFCNILYCRCGQFLVNLENESSYSPFEVRMGLSDNENYYDVTMPVCSKECGKEFGDAYKTPNSDVSHMVALMVQGTFTGIDIGTVTSNTKKPSLMKAPDNIMSKESSEDEESSEEEEDETTTQSNKKRKT